MSEHDRDILSLLLECEWGGTRHYEGERYPSCPCCCRKRVDGHDAHCRMAAAIARLVKKSRQALDEIQLDKDGFPY